MTLENRCAWKNHINYLSNNPIHKEYRDILMKNEKFIQLDFSATPYDVTGSGQKRIKHYFPYIIVDFDLKSAIRMGFVKTIAIDKRKELTDISLDYNAIREGNKVIGLSDGQKLMIRAGLNKLKILEDNFVDFSDTICAFCPKKSQNFFSGEFDFVSINSYSEPI